MRSQRFNSYFKQLENSKILKLIDSVNNENGEIIGITLFLSNKKRIMSLQIDMKPEIKAEIKDVKQLFTANAQSDYCQFLNKHIVNGILTSIEHYYFDTKEEYKNGFYFSISCESDEVYSLTLMLYKIYEQMDDYYVIFSHSN